jgi:hypothetical protein
MPFLLSQLVVKRFLYTVAVMNTLLLGVCGWLFLAPSGGANQTAPAFSPSNSIAPASAIPDQPGLAGAAFQPHPAQPAAAGAFVDDRASHPVLAGSVSGEPDVGTSGPDRISLAWSSEPDSDQLSNAGEVTRAFTVLQAQPPGQATAHTAAESFAIAATSPAAASNAAAPAPAVPLAFTTSPNGATPTQAAALGRLRQDFVDNLGGQNQNPNTPAYAQSWQTAQVLSDSNYAQQFGWQAFVQAQLAQVHGSVQ